MRRSLLIAVGLGVAALAMQACVADRGSRGGLATDLPLLEVRRGRFVHEVTAEGNLSAVKSTTINVPVSSEGSYTVGWVAPDGGLVKAGEVIVRFDREELERKLEDGRADKRIAENELQAGEATSAAQLRGLDRDMEGASLSLDAARRFQPQDAEIFSRHALIEGRIDADLAGKAAAHARMLRVEKQQESAKDAGLIALKVRVAATAIERGEQGLTAIEVVAPHDGILILERDWSGQVVHAGQTVWQGQELARIPDLSTMQAEVHVLEADAGGVVAGCAASLFIEAHPEREIAASVQRVDDLARPRVQQVPVQYFGVTLELGETVPSIMKPGQRVRARLRVQDQDGVIVVPRQAIFQGDGETVAWVLREGRLESVRVRLGSASPGRVVVEEGLVEGDRIALRKPQGLT